MPTGTVNNVIQTYSKNLCIQNAADGHSSNDLSDKQQQIEAQEDRNLDSGIVSQAAVNQKV